MSKTTSEVKELSAYVHEEAVKYLLKCERNETLTAYEANELKALRDTNLIDKLFAMQ